MRIVLAFLASFLVCLMGCTEGTEPFGKDRLSEAIVAGQVTLPDGTPLFDLRVDLEVFGEVSELPGCESATFSGTPTAFDETDANGLFRIRVGYYPVDSAHLCAGVRVNPDVPFSLGPESKKSFRIVARLNEPGDSIWVDLAVEQ